MFMGRCTLLQLGGRIQNFNLFSKVLNIWGVWTTVAHCQSDFFRSESPDIINKNIMEPPSKSHSVRSSIFSREIGHGWLVNSKASWVLCIPNDCLRNLITKHTCTNVCSDTIFLSHFLTSPHGYHCLVFRYICSFRKKFEEQPCLVNVEDAFCNKVLQLFT